MLWWVSWLASFPPQRNAKRDLQKQLEAAKAEIETNRSFVDSTAASLAALRRKLAERDAEIEALRAAAAASAAASPGGRSDMNWARKEGVKQGRNRGAQQIKRLAAQLAELKAAYVQQLYGRAGCSRSHPGAESDACCNTVTPRPTHTCADTS